ncbi:Processive diacylglycerol beta-glucosyltransferase [Sporomusa acidovorans DSM 3132]|uniref:Processive diacylglycerol beta-glucosyltransferase n=1 Tax=Sporomusa acidovorans (strain ATCC 49682 / DSM 3132 / Mol) TaxID=1123286 RepID=A0ABZ3J2M3_SPOA4|nr:glycosyltransferase [Sporomusa acidovorans]OZC24106.1 processive diacylglycerol beta-glucosyltransferase [Sporomusa acidovorans DSM 3132]SDF69236.1 Monogalactosyldiacylglycerol synthase [Sporomusa acidovorans]
MLIISASVGDGHTQAANAIRDELICISPSADIKVVDFLDQTNSLGRLIKEAYLKMIDFFPNVYDFLYHWSQETYSGTSIKNITAYLMKMKLLQLLQNYTPDLLVFTHPFPCCTAAYLRRTRQLATPLVAVTTDFSAHEMWIHAEIDQYFVANHEIKAFLAKRGISTKRIFVSGIPISPKFTNFQSSISRKTANMPIILIMGGGLGLGAVEETVVNLQAAKTKIHIVVVTGKNKKLQKNLLNLKAKTFLTHPLTVIGYTEHIHKLMAKSIMLMTKPGGLTCSEALAMELPILLLKPLPGQEEENADFLTRQGVALQLSVSLTPIVEKLLQQPQILQDMQSKARALRQPDAANHVANRLSACIDNPNTLFPAS